MQDVNRLLAAGQTNQASQLQRAISQAGFDQSASANNQKMAQQRAIRDAELRQAQALKQADLLQAAGMQGSALDAQQALAQANLTQDAGTVNAQNQLNTALANQQANFLGDEAAINAAQLGAEARLGADQLGRDRMMENLDLLSQVGTAEQGLAQQRLDEPFDALQFRAALLGLAPMPKSITERGNITTTQSGPGLLSSLLQAGGQIGAAYVGGG